MIDRNFVLEIPPSVFTFLISFSIFSFSFLSLNIIFFFYFPSIIICITSYPANFPSSFHFLAIFLHFLIRFELTLIFSPPQVLIFSLTFVSKILFVLSSNLSKIHSTFLATLFLIFVKNWNWGALFLLLSTYFSSYISLHLSFLLYCCPGFVVKVIFY